MEAYRTTAQITVRLETEPTAIHYSCGYFVRGRERKKQRLSTDLAGIVPISANGHGCDLETSGPWRPVARWFPTVLEAVRFFLTNPPAKCGSVVVTSTVQVDSHGEGRTGTGATSEPDGDRLQRCERCHDDERERGTPPSPETR